MCISTDAWYRRHVSWHMGECVRAHLASHARAGRRARVRRSARNWEQSRPVQHEMQQPSYNYLCTAKIAQCIISQKNLHYFEWIAFSDIKYRKVTSTSPSCFESHVGLFRLLMKGIFDAYVLWPFGEKFIFELVTRVRSGNSTVFGGLNWRVKKSKGVSTFVMEL